LGVVIGEEELRGGFVKLKDIRSREERVRIEETRLAGEIACLIRLSRNF